MTVTKESASEVDKRASEAAVRPQGLLGCSQRQLRGLRGCWEGLRDGLEGLIGIWEGLRGNWKGLDNSTFSIRACVRLFINFDYIEMKEIDNEMRPANSFVLYIMLFNASKVQLRMRKQLESEKTSYTVRWRNIRYKVRQS